MLYNSHFNIYIHFNPFTSTQHSVQHSNFNAYSLQHIHFNTFTSTHARQHIHFNTFTSTHARQHSDFNTLTSALWLQHSDLSTLTSTNSCFAFYNLRTPDEGAELLWRQIADILVSAAPTRDKLKVFQLEQLDVTGLPFPAPSSSRIIQKWNQYGNNKTTISKRVGLLKWGWIQFGILFDD